MIDIYQVLVAGCVVGVILNLLSKIANKK